ncbi:adenosylcobinamide-GDP ribazoletransferase [Methylotenera sp. G11]|uniref:adenosylcobinamide-GDP ribazoletransferase n=1 Tax=Methylotenera sp. G11 TaxID=1506585 RepID=UPI000647BEC6|nr:adenosylcobinamide-GDP ribazoletransferase [Methylotenera sp. G11]
MLSCLCREWRYLLLAVGFFTRIPVPVFEDFQEQELNHSAKYFPLVGILVGAAGAAMLVVAGWIFPANVAVLLSMATTIYMTGAFHEDGLADSADGLGGGWDRERILTIMQDSRLGTYGALALFLVLFAKFQLLSALPAQSLAYVLIAAHALSRLCAVYMMATLSYVKAAGKAKPLASKVRAGDLTVATLFGLLPLVLVYWSVASNSVNVRDYVLLTLSWLVSVGFAGYWWRRKIRHWLGGYTGDCLGAAQQITELAFYLGVLAYFGFINLLNSL